MRKLIVTLPPNRDLEGTVHLEEDGELLAGPFPVCGRADSKAAERHGNPSRNTLLPFGDTPLGLYRVLGILPSGFGTALPKKQFGPHNVLVLQPAGGDAALADANGRFHTLIQGGKEGRGKKLLPTNGSLRLRDKDQKRLMLAMDADENIECEVRTGAVKGKPVADTLNYELGDPVSGKAREALRKLVVASVFVIGASYNLIQGLKPTVIQYVAVAYKGYLAEEMEKRFGKSKANLFPPGGGKTPFFMAGGTSGDGYEGWPGPSTDNNQKPTSAFDQLKTLAAQGENADWDNVNPQNAVVAPDDVSLPGAPESPIQVPLTPFNNNNNVSIEEPETTNNTNENTNVNTNVPNEERKNETAPPVGTVQSFSQDTSAVPLDWDAGQRQLPSVILFTPPAVSTHYTAPIDVPAPQFSAQEIAAMKKEDDRQKYYEQRPQWLKDLDSSSASALNQITNSVPPVVLKKLWDFMPANDLIKDSFLLGAKLEDDTFEEPDKFKAAWKSVYSKEGGAVVVDFAKLVATHDITDKVTTVGVVVKDGVPGFETVTTEVSTPTWKWLTDKAEDKTVKTWRKTMLGSVVNPQREHVVSEYIEQGMEIQEYKEKFEQTFEKGKELGEKMKEQFLGNKESGEKE